MAYDDPKRHDDRSAFTSAGWFVAGGLAMALLAGVLLYSEGYFDDRNELSIELNVPKLAPGDLPLPEAPDQPILPDQDN